MRRTLTLLLTLALPAAAAAHPLDHKRYDRAVAVRLAADGVAVRYTLEMTQWTIWIEGRKLFTPEEIAALEPTGRALVAGYAKKVAPELAHDLHATLDGKPLTFRVERIEADGTEHPRFQFAFRADWPPGPRQRVFAFEDESFDGKPGVLNLTIDTAGGRESGVTLDDVIEPDARWRTKPAIDLKPDEAARLRKVSAIVNLPAAIEGAKPEQWANTPRSPEPTVTVSDTPQRPLAEDLFHRGLPALFDSTAGVGVLLLAAFLFGVAHAFTPGHGKTLVAAYLVGERGTVGHAVVLGITTTVAHTGSVLLVALGLQAAYGDHPPEKVGAILEFVGGLFVLLVGVWLLLLRMTGRADHVHLFAGHDHHHGDGGHHHHHPPLAASHGTTKTKAGWARVVLLGLGGGIIPCWDAVLLLVVAIALNRFGFAIPLLIAFSVGLATVLVLLGVAVVRAHRAGLSRFGESRWFKLLPIVSSVVLVGVGLWLCKAAVAMAVQ